MDVEKENKAERIEVIFGHRPCQTRDAKWLCLDDLNQKLYRPNCYDVGGTYIDDIPDFWFMYQTERLGNIFLLHLFVSNRHEGNFSLSLHTSSDVRIDKKNKIVYVAKSPKYFNIKQKAMNPNYLTTYHFTELDLNVFKDRNLYIGITLSVTEDQIYLDKIKSEHDFGDLLKDPVRSDFVIESSEGTLFRVHKIILSTQSEVFKAMLKDETAESQNGLVKFIDVCSDDLRCILEFIYTGTVADIDNCNFINLLILADRYNLPGLLELAQHVLKHQLTEDNALEILVVADMYNADQLKRAALNFIKKYKAIFSSSMFKELHVELAREVYEYIILSTS